MAKKGVTFGDRGIFASNVIRRLTGGTGKIEKKNASMTSGALSCTDNFRYDPPGTGVKSTQQIPLDWALLENHTFFNSAEAKVNVAFDEIINYFPFDGTRQELITFQDNLTGYEKYVLDIFPKHVGFLHFSGTSVVENPHHGADAELGSFVTVKDFAGNLFPDLSKDRSGKSILDPGKGSITFEFDLYVPKQSLATHPQVILQKIKDNNQGITLGLTGSLPEGSLSPSESEDTAGIVMMVTSGSAFLSCSMIMPRDKWGHVCATFNRRSGKNQLELYLDSKLQSVSPSYNMEEINFKISPMLIGSGTAHLTGSAEGPYASSMFVPLQTLSGAMDELRVFHNTRTIAQQKASAQKSIFPGANDLKLYFKYNEATGSYTSNDVVLDSSGNSLHSRISNFLTTLRKPHGLDSPLKLERVEDNPVLFPDNLAVTDLNVGMLADALEFDANNPNLITKLIPAHFLLEASYDEGMTGEMGDTGDAYGYYDKRAIPGGGQIPSPQIVASLFYTWAKYFDEMKIFIDHLSNVLHVDYDTDDTVASQFLPFLADYYGFSLPNQFNNASLEQIIDGENLQTDASLSANSLQYIQNQLWRRILINLNEIIRSKGTIHSLKALMRSIGLNPNNNFRFREYGGAKSRDLGSARIFKTEVSAMLDMSGSLRQYEAPVTSSRGTANNKPFVQSPFLSGARVEPGTPLIRDGSAFVRSRDVVGMPDTSEIIGTTEASDGLFTSGSWTYEGIYKFETAPGVPNHFPTQSLVRICTTGSLLAQRAQDDPGLHYHNAYPMVTVNLIAFRSGSKYESGSLRMYARPGRGKQSPNLPASTLVFSLNDVNIFDGAKWHISMGRERNDEIDSVYSSSYFIRAGRQNFGELVEYKSASVYFSEEGDTARQQYGQGGVWQNPTDLYNASGSFFTIGSQSLGPAEANNDNVFLNSTVYVTDDVARYTEFSGRLAQIRFWSKALTITEDMEHARSFKSLGVQDPRTNYNFVKTASGSFAHLRIDASTDQPVTKSDGLGEATLFDFSQATVSGSRGAAWFQSDSMNKKYFHLSGSGFASDAQIIKPERFDYSIIDPKFDEGGTTNKIRIRSWQNYENVEKYGGVVAPLYELPPSEKPTDDTRFAIEISSVQALNEDMISIFATLDSFDNIIGAPELLFSIDYPELRVLRDVYFQRLTDKVKLKSFFEFFKWFDSSVGVIIESLVPRKTKFLGVNFVIESHMLERAKFNYNYSDVYLGENDRHGLKGVILLRQIVGDLKRF